LSEALSKGSPAPSSTTTLQHFSNGNGEREVALKSVEECEGRGDHSNAPPSIHNTVQKSPEGQRRVSQQLKGYPARRPHVCNVFPGQTSQSNRKIAILCALAVCGHDVRLVGEKEGHDQGVEDHGPGTPAAANKKVPKG